MSLKKEFKSEEIESSPQTDSDSPDYLSGGSSKLNKIKMADKVTLSVLTKFIKPYNGDRDSLPAFLTNCENAISLATTDQQKVLCKFIVSQLEGKAQLACCLKKFEKWSDIKQFLKTTFGEKKHSTHLLVDLQNCKQTHSEDVMQYSLRIESCLTRLQSDIHYSCEDEKELPGRIAAMEDLALNTFLLGLNRDFSHIVRCRNPRSLSEAITHAIEEEKLYKLSKLSSRSSSKDCTICHKSGHLANECYKNRKKHLALHVNSTNNNEHNFYYNKSSAQYNPNMICAYCKKRGHFIKECRKLKAKNDAHSYPRNSIPNSNHKAISSPTNDNNRSNMHLIDNDVNTSNYSNSLN